MPETILIIDDDPHLPTLMRLNLMKAGYAVVTASNGMDGLRLLQEYQPDLVLLDVVMPDMDGWETCRRIRAISTVPVIFLTGKQAERDKVKGLDLGADDYISKPFRQAELRARVNAILRRAHMPPPPKGPILRYGNGDLVINTATRTVLVRGQEVELTPTEYRLLEYLARQPGRVLSTEQIYDAVWDIEADAMLTGVKWYIWRLRNKIERDPHHPHFILTDPGVGYRFAAG
jgi:DNA-binding response OmpR family regulator